MTLRWSWILWTPLIVGVAGSALILGIALFGAARDALARRNRGAN